VRLKDSFQEKGVLHILMEYVDGGDLSQAIKQRGTKPFTEEEIMSIFIQLVLGLQYIHDRKIVHRDIKPQNIFLTRVGVAKIGDFGVARALDGTHDLCQTVIGTPYYLSPEVWSNEPYNSQTDIWSLGCILYELCALKRPFTGRDAGQLFAQVIRGSFEPIPTRYGRNTRLLVEAMLTPTASQRPAASEIIQFPFIQARMAAKIRENEAQLKTVNIMGGDPPKVATRQKRASQAPPKRVETPKLPKLASPKPADVELPLPPDEEAPRWAQRGGPQLRVNEMVVATKEDGACEYADLVEATDRLQGSLKGGPRVDEARPVELRAALAGKLGKQLFTMLYGNIQREDDPHCAQFVDIMTESDPDVVELMRELIALET
jgi:NIMA (never in mitosis gene a)-related kinase